MRAFWGAGTTARWTAFSLCMFVAFPAAGAECPAAREIDEIVGAIQHASSCISAVAIAKDCAFGASGDTALTNAASQVCERDFLHDLGPKPRAIYKKRQSDCNLKYGDETGSMYRSFAAFYMADFSRRYSEEARRRRAGH